MKRFAAQFAGVVVSLGLLAGVPVQAGGMMGGLTTPDIKDVGPDAVKRPLPHGFTANIEQGAGQDDPTTDPAIVFDVWFDRAIDPSTFVLADLLLEGSAAAVATQINHVSDNKHFTVLVTGAPMGTVILKLPGGSVETLAGAANFPSVSADNSVYLGSLPNSRFVLYACVWNPAEIYAYTINRMTGALNFLQKVTAPGDCRDMQVAEDGKNLYYGSWDLSRFIISSDGSLNFAGSTPLGDGAVDDLVLTPDGNYLYATHSFGSGTVYGFNTQVTAPAPPVIEQLGGFLLPHGLAIDADGGHLFVANYFLPDEIISFGLLPSGQIDTFNFDETGFFARPMYIVAHPFINRLYWTETTGGSALAGVQNGPTVEFLDAEFSGWGARQLTLNRNGTYLYVTNYNNNDVTIFRTNADGSLHHNVRLVPTGERPEHVIFDPDWDFLYVANFGDGSPGDSTISIYVVQPDGGLWSQPSVVIGGTQNAYRLATVRIEQ